MILCARELSSRRLPLRFGLCYLQKREQSRLPAISKFENDLFNTFTKEHHHGMAQSCDDQQLFADSQFQMLKISEHGSLIQHEENTHDYLFNDQCMFDEEELNLRNTFQEKDTEINFIRNMPKYSRSKNPNETKPFRLIKLSNDATIESSSIDDFFCRVIGNEAAVKDYHYQMPVFPTELTNYSLKHYLRQVNVIDLNYDIHGFEKLIFFQILKICRNISRFDGILDIVVLHELIKFLGKYGMIRSIFKVIDAFEHLGIHPNKDTLHLLIYKLNDIKGLRWRKDLLNFYVLLGTRKWGVSPDKTTEVLSAIQSPPGRPRLAITKRLINEGIDDSYFQNTMFHDYVTIEIESRELPYFERFYHFLLKRKAITDTHENKIILFNMYIEKLASCGKLRHAIEEMKTHEELTTPDTYTALIDQTIKNNVWTGFALLNHLMSQGNVRVSDIGMAIIGNYRTIQENFTKQAQNVNRLHQHNMPQIYNIVIKMLLAKCGYQISGNNKFLLPVERDLPLDEETVISDFQKIQFWNLDTEYSHYNGLLTSRCGGSWIFKLWDVMDIESSPQDNLYINPITFPWI